MTHLVTTGNNQPTMSSREIADLVESRHDKVKQSIERLADRGLITFTPMGEKPTGGRPSTVYLVNKRDSYVVVAQLSPEFTARLVDRWQELEQQAAAPAVPGWITNLSPQARIALDDLNNQVVALTHETDRLQQVCHSIADNLREGMTPTAFCRMLNGVNINSVQPMLVKRHYLIKTKIGYRAASAYRDTLFTERRDVTDDGQPFEKVVLTQKGAKRLFQMYLKDELTMKRGWNGQYTHGLFDDKEGAAA